MYDLALNVILRISCVATRHAICKRPLGVAVSRLYVRVLCSAIVRYLRFVAFVVTGYAGGFYDFIYSVYLTFPQASASWADMMVV